MDFRYTTKRVGILYVGILFVLCALMFVSQLPKIVEIVLLAVMFLLIMLSAVKRNKESEQHAINPADSRRFFYMIMGIIAVTLGVSLLSIFSLWKW